jgi:hypothetical protein
MSGVRCLPVFRLRTARAPGPSISEWRSMSDSNCDWLGPLGMGLPLVPVSPARSCQALQDRAVGGEPAPLALDDIDDSAASSSAIAQCLTGTKNKDRTREQKGWLAAHMREGLARSRARQAVADANASAVQVAEAMHEPAAWGPMARPTA